MRHAGLPEYLADHVRAVRVALIVIVFGALAAVLFPAGGSVTGWIATALGCFVLGLALKAE